MFDGRDYHQKFEEVVAAYGNGPGREYFRGDLESLEWILWEAIRGVYLLSAVFPSIMIVALLGFLVGDAFDLIWKLTIGAALLILLTIVTYWFLKFVFWVEISRHVRGRTFGR